MFVGVVVTQELEGLQEDTIHSCLHWQRDEHAARATDGTLFRSPCGCGTYA